MTPTALNLTIYKGVGFAPPAVVCRDASNAAINVAGWTPYAHAAHWPGGGIVFDLGPTVSNGPAGEVTISAKNATETAALPCGRYGFDLLMEAPNGVRYGPFYQGRIGVSPLHTEPV